MSNIQNDIKEVLDQISLDYADGKYLDRVTGNLGLNRELFGLSDDVWRATAKTVALQYKQILTKFADVIDIILGPQFTIATDLAEDVAAGSTSFKVVDSSKMPQVGTVVLDRGNLAEESLAYNFIDRRTNTVYLEGITTLPHTAPLLSGIAPLIEVDPATGNLYSTFLDPLPTDGSEISVLLNLANGTQVPMTVTTGDPNFLTYVTGDAPTLDLRVVQGTTTRMSASYVTGSYVVPVTTFVGFPETGTLLAPARTFTLTSGSTTSVNLSGLTATTDSFAGYYITFLGDITAAIQGHSTIIASNDVAAVDLLEALPATPAAGDTVLIRPVVTYTRYSVEEGIFHIPKPIPAQLLPLQSETVELVQPSTISTATVQVLGVGWDIHQTSDNLVEIYIPPSLVQEKNILEASRAHHTVIPDPASPDPSAVTTADAAIGDYSITVDDCSDFYSETGMVKISGGGNTTYRAYVRDTTSPNTVLNFGFALDYAYLTGASVVQWQPNYGVTDIIYGQGADAVWAGPYVYDPDLYHPSRFSTTSVSPLAAEAAIAIDYEPADGSKCLEVLDASFMDDGNFPFDIDIFDTNGVKITEATVEYILRKGACVYSNAAVHLAGTTSFTVIPGSPTAPPVPEGSILPNEPGIRLKVGQTPLFEVLTTVSVATGGFGTIVTDTASTQLHSGTGHKFIPMNDVLVLSSPLGQPLTGATDYSTKYTVYTNPTPSLAYKVRKKTASIELASTIGFSLDGGYAIINPQGITNITSTLPAATPISIGYLQLADSSEFPLNGPYDVIIAKGTSRQNIVRVAYNNTGTNQLHLDGEGTLIVPPTIAQLAGASVDYISGDTEVIEYTGITGSAITYPVDFEFDLNHQAGVIVRPSIGPSTSPTSGAGFPFRVPSDLLARLLVLFDLIRAAGVKVVFTTEN